MAGIQVLGALGALLVIGTVVSRVDVVRSEQAAHDRTRELATRMEVIRSATEIYLRRNAVGLQTLFPTTDTVIELTPEMLRADGVLSAAVATNDPRLPRAYLRRDSRGVEGFVVSPPLLVGDKPGLDRFSRIQINQTIRQLGAAPGLMSPEPPVGQASAQPNMILGINNTWSLDASEIGVSGGVWRLAMRVNGPALAPIQTPAPLTGPDIQISNDLLPDGPPTLVYRPTIPPLGENFEQLGFHLGGLREVDGKGRLTVTHEGAPGDTHLHVRWNGTWNGPKNAILTRIENERVTVDRFVDVRLDFAPGAASRKIMINQIKRGSVVTADGDDEIDVVLAGIGTATNLYFGQYPEWGSEPEFHRIRINAGNGNNVIRAYATSVGHDAYNAGVSWWNEAFQSARVDIETGSGNDYIELAQVWVPSVITGAGDDIVDASRQGEDTEWWHLSHTGHNGWIKYDLGPGDDTLIVKEYTNPKPGQHNFIYFRRGDGADQLYGTINWRDKLVFMNMTRADVSIQPMTENFQQDGKWILTYGSGDVIYLHKSDAFWWNEVETMLEFRTE